MRSSYDFRVDVEKEMKRCRKLVRRFCREYRMPTIVLKFSDSEDMADCLGLCEEDGEIWKIVLNAKNPDEWLQTLVHELSHCLAGQIQKAGLSKDEQDHGRLFFHCYAELYQRYIEE